MVNEARAPRWHPTSTGVDRLTARSLPTLLEGTSGDAPRRPDGTARPDGEPPEEVTCGVPAGEGPDDARTEGALLRERAMRSAMTAYTAAHGHPLEHPDLTAGTRWGMSVRVALATTAVLLVLTAGVVARTLLAAPPTTAPAPTEPGARPDVVTSVGSDGSTPREAATSPGPAPLVVHVVGQVARPGLVQLPAGARVADAITAAGGATPDADLAAVNLARPVTDGEQLRVPLPGEVVPPPPEGLPTAPPTAPAGAPVDLNTADAVTLEGLPGIGPVLAGRIVEHRETYGPFSSVEDLTAVSGIGPAVLARIRDVARAG